MRLGLIGFGAIGRWIAQEMCRDGDRAQLVSILVQTRKPRGETFPLCYDIETFLASNPTIVVEAAGHDAVRKYALPILQHGCSLILSSIGVLADPVLRKAIIDASVQSGARVLIPSGAIAGLDGLASARLAGLSEVAYTSLKPPEAWRDTAAEDLIDLDHIEPEVTFFEDTAEIASKAFPRNTNVSAAIALAGLGFERTRVRLVSSRRIDGPVGIIEASGYFGSFNFQIAAKAFEENPKSSMLAACSLLQSARNGIGIPLTTEFADQIGR